MAFKTRSRVLKDLIMVGGGLVAGGAAVFFYIVYTFDRAWRRGH